MASSLSVLQSRQLSHTGSRFCASQDPAARPSTYKLRCDVFQKAAAARCRAAAGGGGDRAAAAPAAMQRQQQQRQQQQQPLHTEQHGQQPAEQQQQQGAQPARARRRELLLGSLSPLPLLALAELSAPNDATTLVNSLLGAYGLPQLAKPKGFRTLDDPEAPYSFAYPRSWVARANQLREGLYIADYQTADKASLELFPEPPPGVSLAEAAVQKIMFPASEIGGDARLELPPADRIRTERKTIDGRDYLYIAWNSETTTRSGYQVKRKNLAVAAARRGVVYALGCSARSDQWDKKKEEQFQQVVSSFRLYN